jgi:hypothetical protein
VILINSNSTGSNIGRLKIDITVELLPLFEAMALITVNNDEMHTDPKISVRKNTHLFNT